MTMMSTFNRGTAFAGIRRTLVAGSVALCALGMATASAQERGSERGAPEEINLEASQRFDQTFERHLRVALEHLKEPGEDTRDNFDPRELRRIESALEEGTLDAYIQRASIRMDAANARRKIPLQLTVYSLADYGSTIANSGNLQRVRGRFLHRARLLHGPEAARKLRGELRAFRRVDGAFYRVVWDFFNDLGEPDSPPPGPVNDTSQMNCTTEIGYSSTGNDSATACLPPGASGTAPFVRLRSDGLLAQFNIPLEPHLTCTKNQANRGTCVGFAQTANLETRASVNRGQRYNLSEQYTYFKSEINTGTGRYSDGLPTNSITKEWGSNDWGTGRETTWTYNQSNSRDPLETNSILTWRDNVYPNSCSGYSEYCTDYAFQGGANNNHSVFYRPDPQISVDNITARTAHEITFGVFTSARSALVDEVVPLLNANVPVIVSFGVTQAYMDGDGAGYITWSDRGDSVNGGHANLIVGYVDKDDLPAGTPEPDGDGYFILKNSWGAGWGDCGYGYVDEKWLRNKLRGLITLSIN